MDSSAKIESNLSLEMANEAFYRDQADFYRNSPEYNRMINEYPVLRDTIGDCQNESFVA